jgi:hypothetical protein
MPKLLDSEVVGCDFTSARSKSDLAPASLKELPMSFTSLMGLLLGAFAAREMCLHLVGKRGNPRLDMCSKRRSPYVERCRLPRHMIES